MNVLRTVLAFAATAWCAPPTNQPSECKASPSWPGFPGIKNVFSFGDSYTSTNFDPDGQQPTEVNPLGNPEYPGQTSAWPAANWIDFLTTKYNQSSILTYNIAVGGATVDRSLEDHNNAFGRLATLLGQVKGQAVFEWPPTLVEQVYERFAPRYNQKDGTTPLARPWNGNDTLFAFWFGVNDINGSYQRGKKLTDPLNRKIIESYSRVLRYLFDEHDMRNAVVMNVPAIDRSPWTRRAGKENQKLEKADLADFNGLIWKMVQDFKAYDVDDKANIWVYDSNTDFDKVMSNPKSFSQTSLLKNTTDACPLYGPIGTPENDTFIEECGVPVNQYFWLNDLHPTYPIHEAVAAQIVKLLGSDPNTC